MSPVTVRRVELRLFKNAAAPHLFALPASGATVQLFRRTVATAAVEVAEHETVTVPVADSSGFQIGENVRALGGPDRDFSVRSVGTNSLQLDYVGVSEFTLAVGERIRSLDPLTVYANESGTGIPATSLTVDSVGSVTGFIELVHFDYEVSDAPAGSAAGYYLDGHSGGGGPALATLNVHDFASIQAAIDALPPWGGTVFIPAGNHQLTETLYLPCDRPCHLVGELAHDHVARGTVLEWTTNVGMLRVRGDFSSVRNLKLRNTSFGQATREDEGYGIAIGRRDRIDAHPHPEPTTATPATEYARGEIRPLYSVLIEDVVISDSPGWGIHIPGVGLLSDEATEEYDRVLGSKTEGAGTLSFGLQFKRVRVHNSRRHGGLFIGSGCTTVSFEECDFLHQGAGEVPNSTYYAYLAGCDQPSFERCVFEGFSSTDKAWVRLFGTSDAVFDACLFENDPPPPTALPPTYFLQLKGVGGTPCRGGAIRHCRFVRGANCAGHMNVVKLEQGGSAGFHFVGSGGVSVDEAWDSNANQFRGLPHFDLGAESNTGIVVTGAPLFRDNATTRQLQIANPPRAASISTRSHARMPASTTSQLFSASFDDPAIRLEGNLVLNADLGSGNPGVACPMYRLGGTDQAPKWRLVNNAPTLTEAQRDARTNWVQGDVILMVPASGPLQLQVRLDSGWKTVTLT